MPPPTEPKPSQRQALAEQQKKEEESPASDTAEAAREPLEKLEVAKSPIAGEGNDSEKRRSPEKSPSREPASQADRAKSLEPPTEDEIKEFLKRNDVDERAAQDLRDCPPDMQRKVIDRGELNSARNTSAALIVRIRDARMDAKASSGSKAGMGLPSSSEIKDFIKAYNLDDAAAEALRSSSPTMKRTILNDEEYRTASDASALVLARVGSRRGSKGSTGLAAEVEAFIKQNDLDRRAAADLKGCAQAIQRDVIFQGDLEDVRNKHAALLSRIREAKTRAKDASQSGYPGYPHGYPPYGYGYPPPGYPGYGYPGYPGYPGYGYPGGAYAYPHGAYGYPTASPDASGQAAAKNSKGSRSGSYSGYSYSSYSASRSRSPSRRSRKSSHSSSRSRSPTPKKKKKRRVACRESSRDRRGRNRRR